MDLATIFGLIASLGLVALAVGMSGNAAAFLDVPSLLIVVGGTALVTMVSFKPREFATGGLMILNALVHNTPDFSGETTRLVKLSQKARKDALMGIQGEIANEPHPFLRQGLSLALDNTPVELIERIMMADTATLMERYATAISMLRRAAELGPAMGLIGTLIGLVQMLSHLADPDTIGPAMAIAILTTFYGAVLSYMVFTPLANKIERISADDLLLRKIYTMGVASMAKRENPRQMELHLNAQLPPALRSRVFR
ncbi:MAG TPA: MotA/TolQ/ExbB proton channel family protein [Alphaproteobacteria bacterium]|nr:MotA/TolQ/ExbB proton channel family protein [Alphaproteobacteria bacterium]